MGEPDDVVLQLVRDAARGELQLITAEARTSPEAVEEAAAAAAWVQELDDPAASVAATARLVAWLVVRAQNEHFGAGFVTADQGSPSVSVVPRPADGPSSGSVTGAPAAIDALPTDQFEALIRMGRARGGLTQDDVMTVLRTVELSADLISEVVERIREAGIEFTYDTGETTVVPMTGAVADDLSGSAARGVPGGTVRRRRRHCRDAAVPPAGWSSLDPARDGPGHGSPDAGDRIDGDCRRPDRRRPRPRSRRSGPPGGRRPPTATPTGTASGARRPTRCTCTSRRSAR